MEGQRWGSALEGRSDPSAGVGRIDHIVDLEVGRGVERLAVLVHAGDHVLEKGLTLGVVVDGLQLAAEPQLHRSFQPHAAELAGRPGDGEQRGLEAAAGHGLGAEAVALAQDDREERHADAGARDEHPRRVPHERRLLDLRSDHDAGRIAQREQRNVERVA